MSRKVWEFHFVEKRGAPALKLIGDINGVIDADKIIYAESAYPHTMAHVLAETGINQYEFQAVLWKYKIKGDPKYHTEVSTGRKSKINKYSKSLIDLIRAEIRNDPNIISKVKRQFSTRNKKANK
jgi:hypothetical protein